MIKRNIYQCRNTGCKDFRIKCKAGHILDPRMGTRGLPYHWLREGKPMIITACQNCPDYLEMGPPIPKSERGWINLLTGHENHLEFLREKRYEESE